MSDSVWNKRFAGTIISKDEHQNTIGRQLRVFDQSVEMESLFH
jgi:hypothetical protein